MRKGVIFTLDATLALLIALVFMIAINNMVSGYERFSAEERLPVYSADFAAVLEKTGALRNAVLDSSMTDIEVLMGWSPQSICMRTNIRSSGGEFVMGATESDCTLSRRKEFFIGRRSFVVYQNTTAEFYYAEVFSWIE